MKITPEEFLAGNKNIADYMGVKWNLFPKYEGGWFLRDEWCNDIHYHEDWGLLMEVLAKIAAEKFDVMGDYNGYSIYPNQFSIWYKHSGGMSVIHDRCALYPTDERNLIETVWLGVVNFLRKYYPQNSY